MKALLTILLLASLVMSCGPDTHTLSSYKAWLYSTESGLSDSVSRTGRTYHMTIIPRSLRKIRGSVDDRVTMLLRVYTSDTSLADASFSGISPTKDYATRVANLSFHIKDLTFLDVGSKRIKAIASTMPHAQGFRRYSGIYVTFPIKETELADAGACTVTFDDAVFGEGRMQWQFKTNELATEPIIYEERNDEAEL